MKEQRELIVDTPAVRDMLKQFRRILHTSRRWKTWYYAQGGDKLNWEFQGAGDHDHPEKTDRICKINPESLDRLDRMGMARYLDLCSLGAKRRADLELQGFRKRG